MAALERRSKQNNRKQRCSNCGTPVGDWHQWFLEDCPSALEGHRVRDWLLLRFSMTQVQNGDWRS
jgi:hypothetical protein